MIIRPEEKQDFNEIYTVVKAAFAQLNIVMEMNKI